MEELAVVGALAAVTIYFVADLFGVMMGHGWGFYSRKRKAAKAAKKELKAND